MTASSRITDAAVAAGWAISQDSDTCGQYVKGWHVITVLWTSGGDVFAATLALDLGCDPGPAHRYGMGPSYDSAAAEAAVMGWFQQRREWQATETVLDISAPTASVTELDFAVRGRLPRPDAVTTPRRAATTTEPAK